MLNDMRRWRIYWGAGERIWVSRGGGWYIEGLECSTPIFTIRGRSTGTYSKYAYFHVIILIVENSKILYK